MRQQPSHVTQSSDASSEAAPRSGQLAWSMPHLSHLHLDQTRSGATEADEELIPVTHNPS